MLGTLHCSSWRVASLQLLCDSEDGIPDVARRRKLLQVSAGVKNASESRITNSHIDLQYYQRDAPQNALPVLSARLPTVTWEAATQTGAASSDQVLQSSIILSTRDGDAHSHFKVNLRAELLHSIVANIEKDRNTWEEKKRQDWDALMALKDLVFKVLKMLHGSQTADPHLQVLVSCIPEPVVSNCAPFVTCSMIDFSFVLLI